MMNFYVKEIKFLDVLIRGVYRLMNRLLLFKKNSVSGSSVTVREECTKMLSLMMLVIFNK
jgi:hypothetical protein